MKKTKIPDIKIISGEFNNNIPEMPKDLSHEAKYWWKRLIKSIDSKVLMPCDDLALILLVDSLAAYHKTKMNIRKFGDSYETVDDEGHKKRYMRPEVEILSIFYRSVIFGLREFLISPYSREDFSDFIDDSTDNI